MVVLVVMCSRKVDCPRLAGQRGHNAYLLETYRTTSHTFLIYLLRETNNQVITEHPELRELDSRVLICDRT